jgi:GNAT superfamily N-acetyltransferase
VSLVESLDWDSSFFGVPIGRVDGSVNAAGIAAAVAEAESRGLACVYLRVPAENSELVATAEARGFRVREVRVELARPVAGHPAAIGALRVAGLGDLDDLAPIARERFRDTRFFADPHFERSRSAELYVEWLRRGLTTPAERRTLVADDAQGFVVCRLDPGSSIGTIELIGVAERAAGRGLGRSLVAGAGALFDEAALERAEVATQGSNIGAQALYQACGYRTAKVCYWLHTWLADLPRASSRSMALPGRDESAR